jgi:hypothetical protein
MLSKAFRGLRFYSHPQKKKRNLVLDHETLTLLENINSVSLSDGSIQSYFTDSKCYKTALGLNHCQPRVHTACQL